MIRESAFYGSKNLQIMEKSEELRLLNRNIFEYNPNAIS